MLARTHAKLLQSCPTLCDPVDCSLPGSSVHGILQAKILEWAANPEIEPTSLMSPAFAREFFTTSTIWKDPKVLETSGNEYSKPWNNLLPFLVPNSFCLWHKVTSANLLQIPVAYGLLTVQLEVGWWSNRPTISWWNQGLHACPWIENPPSHPSRPGFPRLTLH